MRTAALTQRVALGAFTALALAACTPSDPQPAGPPQVLSGDAVTKAARAALAAAEAEGQHVTVSIVDRAGNERLRLTGDGAGPQSGDSARGKAFTAAAWGKPTSELTDQVSGGGASLRDIPGTVFLGGGVPVIAGSPIAGIGVAGAPSEDLDEEFASAGLEAIEGDLG
ncbi:heme-binding protein [Saccharopolyspora sp. NPDC002686]|uniref:GlcG/HbpS family heme-binding protein n=1 Tax=Saccharopolyspora sp. NPDC002686 TaxID=3154541 RepID=UPI00332AE87B